MSDKYVVPEGMLKAAWAAGGDATPQRMMQNILEAALKWQAENPIVASEEVISEISLKIRHATSGAINEMLQEWQRRMYLAPPDDFERECRDLEVAGTILGAGAWVSAKEHNDHIREAFRRGQRSKS